MNNKLQIIEVSDYILAVSDEEITDVRLYKDKYHLEKGNIINIFPDYLTDLSECQLIVGYQAKGNSAELDLPLLPPFKKEIVGYRLKPNIDRFMVDGILKTAMPIWNDEDKSVYFIKGHVAGSLVAKMKELQVLDLWFTPIYEEVKSNWVKEHHLEYYYKEGIMSDEIVIEDDVENLAEINSEKHHYAFGQQSEFYQLGFIEGYKAATKVYSEDDLVEFCMNMLSQYTQGNTNIHNRELLKESLTCKQSKPKWFVVEMKTVWRRNTDRNVPTKDDLDQELKTTTINGKNYLVGTYLYE
jgi:hypothetical protein